MSSLLHTYGPTCLLYDPEDNPTTKSDFSTSTAPPKVRAQFFYLSSFPIDDPLTPLPAASASSSSSQSSFPPRPFSVLDNIALEEAWHGLRNAVEDQDADDTRKSGSEEDRANRAWRQKVDRLILEALTAVREYRDASPDLNVTPINERHDTSSIFALVEKHAAIYGSSEGGETEKRRFVVSTLRNVIEQISRQKESAWRHDLRPIIVALFCAAANEIPNQEKDTSTKVADKFSRQVCEQEEPAGVPIPIRMPAESAGDVEASSNSMGQILDPYNSPKSLKRHSPPADRKSKTSKRISISSPCGDDVFGSYSSQTGRPIPSAGVHGGDTNITGSPFIRAPARSPRSVPSPRSPATPSRASHPLGGMVTVDQGSDVRSAKSRVHSAGSPSKFTVQRLSPSELEVTPVQRKKEPDAVIPVGISRLHSVELPNLEMKPIYWSPIHDISSVIRATWFYKNTMLPVEPELANQLEAGYMYMQPWTETWQDELNSCIENGAEAEIKIVHPIWPPEEEVKEQSAMESGHESKPSKRLSLSKPTEAEAGSIVYENQAAGSMTLPDAPRPFKNSSVIYVDSKEAQILRPNLLPSAARGRRPLSAIRKGRQIGIPVVRGFNAQTWDKLHPVKIPASSGRRIVKMHQTAERDMFDRRPICYACQIEDRRPVASDLVLVIHGIGQKLSERVESYHFTHAINAFRRQVNIELNSDAVWPHMRPELESIMVLPVNWRSTLSLEDADIEASTSEDLATNKFSLKDITPETMPAIRSLISDVLLDVPYYLSHHKQKMVQAVVKEANRIYRLWCQNNPGFRKTGKVHLIAHSLGSIMAMDILSQQPTHVGHIDFAHTEISQTIFEFDASNVFFCGSPAGFFLLLNKSTLLPRQNRGKPGTNGEDLERGVAGEAGIYGCLAVDNLYNVMHDTDPITYRLNAAVDSDLANSLKPASVPSSSTSLFQTVTSVFRWGSLKSQDQSSTDLSAPSVSQQNKRPAGIAKLPSSVEMETHDFSREELAEKRMALLNDNGQIDFYISGGGGPLSIQYLNMLSAHSSYWVLQDFVRFLVVEIGRKRGRDGTLLALRAEKKKGWKRARAY
ncbi:DDHD domain-containing protein [Histoplasma capsulatum G186AR]|uniref:DDHD domain-containing protein n=1 Tax=Ajellomyces capsulatus TaxID=5037 RepID=A0A8H7YQZ6_AJECA|nr:DDHD domain-containing protein [Histoplasma capsulatum]QSS75589.1 DDHD domain-containing protein [Histoplasma capsulatum G186AR]